MPSPAVIVLEDGVTFAGEALAGSGSVGGEIVFNTSMTGYQEIATDPSYCGQLVTYTFPMNGNYGADADRDESGKAHARAIIARELTNYRYNRASRQTWLDWLAEHGVLAVSGVDTRALTRHIREKGALRAVVSTEVGDVKHLRKSAQGLPVMGGLDLAKVVTCDKTYEAPAPEGAPAPDLHVVAYDYGIKRSMLGYLAGCGFRVTVVPAQTSAREGAQARAGRRLPEQRPRRSRPRSPTPSRPSSACWARCPSSASASGTSSSPRRSGSRRSSSSSATAAPTTRSRTCAPASSRSPPRTTASPSATRRWPAPRSRTSTSTTGPSRASRRPTGSPSPCSTTRSPRPGPHDSLYLFERFRDEIDRFKRGGEA